MKLEYVEVFNGVDQNGKLRPLLINDIVDVKFKEVAEADMPMALTFKREASATASHYRIDMQTGDLFQRGTFVSKMELLSRTEEANPLYERTRAAYRRIRFPSLGYRPLEPQEFEHNWSKLPDGVTVEESEIARVRSDVTSDAISRTVIIGNRSWIKVREPVFCVYATNNGWKTVLLSSPDGRLGSDRRYFHFGLAQYEEMLEWKNYLAAKTGRAITTDELVSYSVYEPKRDGYALDLRFALQDMLTRMDVMRRDGPKTLRKELSYAEMPLPLIEIVAKARRLLTAEEAGWTEENSEEVVSILEDVPNVINQLPDFAPCFAKPKENAWHIEKWNNRPMGLGAANSMQRTP